MRADEAHQLELEQRQRDEDEMLANHKALRDEFRPECRALMNRYINRKGNQREHESEQSEL